VLPGKRKSDNKLSDNIMLLDNMLSDNIMLLDDMLSDDNGINLQV
jgi:hypothetical protein